MPAAALKSPSVAPLIDLEQMPVFLSASMPGALKGTPEAYKLQDFVVVFVRALLDSKGTLIFGGHPTLTPLVRRIAYDFSGPPRIELFQWSGIRGQEREEAHDSRVFNLHWVDDPHSLEPMREEMVRRSRAAVFLGGKMLDETPLGGKPGIRDEYERYLRCRPYGPAYLLGLLGGESRVMIGEGIDEPNSLTPFEREQLHATEMPEIATSMILTDLRRQLRASRSAGSSEARSSIFPLAAKRH